MRLNKAQREALLSWLAEGLLSDEANRRSAVFEPPFAISRQTMDGYRKRWNIRIAEIREEADNAAIREGLAKKSERVLLLRRLAEHMTADLFERKLFWTSMVKGIGDKDNYERIEYEEFNGAEVTQLRGVLDDIAKEVGERKIAMELGGKLDVVGFGTLLERVYGSKDKVGSERESDEHGDTSG